MDDIKYFEDAWLALENELREFDSFQTGSPYQNYQSSNQDSADFTSENQPNFNSSSYEQLLTNTENKDLSDEAIHSFSTKEDRIRAIRDYYNQNPFVVYARLNKIANNLYKKGMVKQGNKILDTGFRSIGQVLEKALQKHFIYTKELDNQKRQLEYSETNGDKIYTVTIENMPGTSIAGTFDNLKDALEMFYKGLDPED